MSGDDAGADSSPEAGRTHDPIVVVVDPKTPGNVGTIARAMKNFGLSELKLVNPPELHEDGEAYGFAGHAREDVLPEAEEVTFDEVVDTHHTIGTTAITNDDSRRHVRFPFKTPVEVRESLKRVDTRTALVFGREGTGLDNDELARLDEVCSIPASAEYPVLNLGQAATILLYELQTLTVAETQLPDVERERADEAAIDRFYDFFGTFHRSVESREHKREKTRVMMRRLLGRAHPTEREITTLTGIFRRANDLLGDRSFGDHTGESGDGGANQSDSGANQSDSGANQSDGRNGGSPT
ncbi:RNA methyltransferase [Halobellus salinus]|uniref:RNA methyltransferase n=1 Tax=Halobellus salinus TaxID=931585 RepID=A0A830E7T3_9EURY|nr:RNA methyltransferase [Halobellus salinus]GGI98486.1 RNA methyltransferase [Halobellus salinus]SMP05992.1 RNA methyltransferase, TrmH family, group 1 [Halobellus salinus]